MFQPRINLKKISQLKVKTKPLPPRRTLISRLHSRLPWGVLSRVDAGNTSSLNNAPQAKPSIMAKNKPQLNPADDPLRVFIFTVQEGPLMVNVKEDLQAILAHTEQIAAEVARAKYPMGKTISLRKRAEFPVEKLLKVIKPELPKFIPSKKVESKTVKKKEFINGLMLVADKFVKDKRDQASLKKIINKVINDEPSKKNS